MPEMMTSVATPGLQMPDGCLEACAERLFADLRGRCGFRRDELLMRKLNSAVARFTPDEAVDWVEHMVTRPDHDPEWLALVEGVTVHETFFFRDPAQLDMLSLHGLPELIEERARAGDRRLAIWSAGCASGEEAYTLAILVLRAFLQAGCEPKAWAVDILGTDISTQMIMKARDGVYGGPGLDSFRQMPAENMVYFMDVEGAQPYRKSVHPELTALVRFHQHNLMGERPPGDAFDIVLCRNVMMYFEDEGQVHTQELLTRSLAQGGLLLLGVTDRIADAGRYERCQADNAVIYRKLD